MKFIHNFVGFGYFFLLKVSNFVALFSDYYLFLVGILFLQISILILLWVFYQHL